MGNSTLLMCFLTFQEPEHLPEMAMDFTFGSDLREHVGSGGGEMNSVGGDLVVGNKGKVSDKPRTSIRSSSPALSTASIGSSAPSVPQTSSSRSGTPSTASSKTEGQSLSRALQMAQSPISPSAADLNERIASTKKVS